MSQLQTQAAPATRVHQTFALSGCDEARAAGREDMMCWDRSYRAYTRRPLVMMEVTKVCLDVRDALDLVAALERPSIRERRSFQD